MKEFLDLIKELLMLKPEKTSMVGLSGFKNVSNPIAKKVIKKEKKEMRLSELMRRSSKSV